jgi:hypothetical protein
MSRGITSRQYLLQLNIIYGAQALTLVTFGTISFALRPKENPDPEFSTILHYALAALLILSLFGAHFIFKLVIDGVDQGMPLGKKLQKFLTAMLIRVAFLEASGLFSGVVILLTGSTIPLIVLALVILLLYFFRPTISQLTQELRLTIQEKIVLENPDAELPKE